MARSIHELAALVSSRMGGFVQGMRKGSDETRKFSQTWAKAGKAVGRAAAGIAKAASVAAAGIAATSIKIASDAQEIQSKFEAVFKNLTPQAEAFVKDFAGRIGRSMVDVREQMASFQDTFVPLGFAREEALKLSQSMVALTTDLASFNNMSDGEAQAALTSALVGNHETVRRFGVIITQATLDQELFNMGIEGGVKAASEQQKVLARLNLIMKGTTDAQGDAERTAGSFANQLKAAQGMVKDISAEIGSALLPVLSKLLEAFQASGVGETIKNDWVPWLQSAIEWFGDLWISGREAVDIIGAGVGTLFADMDETLRISWNAIKNYFSNFGELATETFKNVARGMIAAMRFDAQGAASALKDQIKLVAETAASSLEKAMLNSESFGEGFRAQVRAIQQRASEQRAALRGDSSSSSPAATSSTAVPAAPAAAGNGGSQATSAISNLTAFASEKFTQLKAAGSKMADTVGGVAQAFGQGAKAAEMMTGWTQKLSATVEKAANEARLKMMERLLAGKGTKEDKDFLADQIMKRNEEIRSQFVTSAFNNAIQRITGTAEDLGKTFYGLGDEAKKFGEKMSDAGDATAKSLGSEDSARAGEAFGTLGAFLNSLSGQYTTIVNNIQLLTQQLPLLDRASQRQRVLDQIQQLQNILRQLAAPRAPLFTGAAIGDFAGVLGYDPGLQGGSVNLGGVHVHTLDGRKLLDTINLEMQRAGQQQFF